MAPKRNFRRNRLISLDKDLDDVLVCVTKAQDGRNSSVSSSMGKYAAIAASFSQVLMLVVVVWGYFYTVVPVFQKEKLTEDLARIEIEKYRLQQEMENYTRDIQINKKKISYLESEKHELETAMYRIRSEKQESEKTLEKLDNREKMFRKNLKLTTDALSEAEKQLYDQQRLRLLGKTPIPAEIIFIFNKLENVFGIFERSSQNAVADKLIDSFIQPIEFVDYKIEELRKQAASESSKVYRNVQLRLIGEYKEGINKNASILQCPEPNFQSWQFEFGRALAIGDEMVEECIGYHFQYQGEQNGWSPREISSPKDSMFWREQREIYHRSCLVVIEHKIGELYRERWGYINEPCKERLKNISSIALEPESTLRLLPFRDMSPPSESYVRSQIQSLIDGWRKATNLKQE